MFAFSCLCICPGTAASSCATACAHADTALCCQGFNFGQSENHHAASSFAVQHSMLLSLLLLMLVAFTGCNVLVSGGLCMHSIQNKQGRTRQDNGKDIVFIIF